MKDGKISWPVKPFIEDSKDGRYVCDLVQDADGDDVFCLDGIDGYNLPRKKAKRDQIIAALNAPAIPQWQPIETAPRDGTEIVLCRGQRVSGGSWNTIVETQRENTPEGIRDFKIGEIQHWYSNDGCFSEDEPPTHWMPMPAPPEPEPEPEADPVELIRVLVRDLEKCTTNGIAQARDFLAAHGKETR